MTYIGYFDGGSRGNPGIAGAGAVIYDDDLKIWEGAKPLGKRTNNEAEYEAVAMLISEAVKMGITNFTVRGDSKLVINQLSGLWKIKEPRLRALNERISRESEGLSIKFEWIPREKNKEADRLSNEAMDGNDLSINWDTISPDKTAEGKGNDFEVQFVILKDRDKLYSLDLVNRSCSCDEFKRNGRCRHIDGYLR